MSTSIVVVTSVFGILATVAVLLRTIRRATQSRRVPVLPSTHAPQADDWAWVLALAAVWASGGATYAYHGRPSSPSSSLPSPPPPPGNDRAVALAVDLTWAVATGCLRCAVVLTARRLFFVVGGRVTAAVWVLLGVNVAGTAASVAVLAGVDASFLASAPPPAGRGGGDGGVRAARLATGIAGLLLGAAAFSATPAIIRHWRVRKMGAFRRRDAARVAMYLLSWASVAVGVARVVAVPPEGQTGGGNGDLYVLLSFLEPSVGLLMGCVPAIRKMFRPGVFGPKAPGEQQQLQRPRRPAYASISEGSARPLGDETGSQDVSAWASTDERAGSAVGSGDLDVSLAQEPRQTERADGW